MGIEFGRDYDGEKKLALTTVKGVPEGKSPRFCRDDKMNIAAKKLKGYHFPTEKERENIEVPAGSVDPDGTIRLGDTVLMLVDKDQLKQNRRDHDDLVKSRRRAIKSDVANVGRSLGVPTFDAREDVETKD